jgi:FixJ family two-component response regulator
MSVADPIVYVVDDEASVRRAMARLFRSVGLDVLTFDSANQFLEHPAADRPGCVVLDLEMPGLGGMELQQELTERHVDLPVVFMTGYGDIPTTVQAMKQGAVDFLTKPVNDKLLLETVQRAIDGHTRQRQQLVEVNQFRQRTESLTPREREVMLLVITGLLNKQIATRLGITETTVKVHRGRVMQKTGVDSVAQLAMMCDRAGFDPTTQ